MKAFIIFHTSGLASANSAFRTSNLVRLRSRKGAGRFTFFKKKIFIVLRKLFYIFFGRSQIV